MLKIRTTMPEFYCIFCYIRNVSIEDGKIIKNNNQFFRKMSIPQGKFLDIVNLILITTLNTLDSEFYEQTDGNAMGGAASSPTAEIYIYAGYEENAMSNCTKHSKNFGTILLWNFVYPKISRPEKLFPSHQQSLSIGKSSLLQWSKKVMEN